MSFRVQVEKMAYCFGGETKKYITSHLFLKKSTAKSTLLEQLKI